MVLTFKNILNPPNILFDRLKDSKQLFTNITNIEKLENRININGRTHSQTDKFKYYDNIIVFESNKITFNTTVKVFCSCESFKFEFAHLLFKNNALTNIDFFSFKNSTSKKHKLGVCKHLISLSHVINKQLDKINLGN